MRRHRIGTAVVAAVSLALSAGSALAEEIPADLEYTYTLNQPVIGQMSLAAEGGCTQSQGPEFTLALTGGVEQQLTDALASAGNDVVCTLLASGTITGTVITGTVSASSEGKAGNGDFTLTCDAGRSMSSWFHVVVDSGGDPALAADPYGVDGEGYVSCSWTISVKDAQNSQLTGTLEMQGAFSQDSTVVDWSNCASLGLPIPPHALERAKCVSFEMEISAYLTGATGEYAGLTGDGGMTQTVYAPMIIPISLGSTPPPPPDCPPEQSPCQALDLTNCEYSATNPGDPAWMDLSALPRGAKIPGFKGPGWYRCGGGGGGEGGLSGCQFSPTEQTGAGWSFITLPLPPGVPNPPGYQGPGWYNCGDLGGGGGGGGTEPPCIPDGSGGWVPPPGASTCVRPGIIDPRWVRSAFTSMLSPRGLGDLLSLKTKAGKASAPRFASPAKTSAAATVRDFRSGGTKPATVRIATQPGAVCTVTAKAGKATTTLAKSAKTTGGQLDTKVTAAKLMSVLKASKGSKAVLTATCSVKSGQKTAALPKATITARFA